MPGNPQSHKGLRPKCNFLFSRGDIRRHTDSALRSRNVGTGIFCNAERRILKEPSPVFWYSAVGQRVTNADVVPNRVTGEGSALWQLDVGGCGEKVPA